MKGFHWTEYLSPRMHSRKLRNFVVLLQTKLTCVISLLMRTWYLLHFKCAFLQKSAASRNYMGVSQKQSTKPFSHKCLLTLHYVPLKCCYKIFFSPVYFLSRQSFLWKHSLIGTVIEPKNCFCLRPSLLNLRHLWGAACENKIKANFR